MSIVISCKRAFGPCTQRRWSRAFANHIVVFQVSCLYYGMVGWHMGSLFGGHCQRCNFYRTFLIVLWTLVFDMYVLFTCCMSLCFFLCVRVSIWMVWIWWTGVRWLRFVWRYNSSQFTYTSILSPITESWYCENGHVCGKLTVFNSWRKPTTNFNRSLRLAPQCIIVFSSIQ